MKKVLFIRANPATNDSRVEKETMCLKEAGYDITILAWDREDEYREKYEDKRGIKIVRIGIKAGYGRGILNLINKLKFQCAIISFLRRHGKSFSIIHACDFDTANVAYFFCKKYNIKFIYDIFDYYVDAYKVPAILKKFVEVFDRSIINNADAVIICTENRKKQIEGCNPKRLEIIHNSPYEVDIQPNILNDGKMVIAYFGILSSGRMLEELLEIVQQDSRYILHIGGFGILENKIIDIANFNKRIIFYGALPYEKVLEYENECNLMIALYNPKVNNHRYAAPNKFYEALMLGKPLVMCKETGMSELVSKNDFGILVNYDKISLQSGLNYMYENFDYYSKKQMEERELYSKMFSWDIMKKRLIELYKEIEK